MCVSICIYLSNFKKKKKLILFGFSSFDTVVDKRNVLKTTMSPWFRETKLQMLMTFKLFRIIVLAAGRTFELPYDRSTKAREKAEVLKAWQHRVESCLYLGSVFSWGTVMESSLVFDALKTIQATVKEKMDPSQSRVWPANWTRFPFRWDVSLLLKEARTAWCRPAFVTVSWKPHWQSPFQFLSWQSCVWDHFFPRNCGIWSKIKNGLSFACVTEGKMKTLIMVSLSCFGYHLDILLQMRPS